MGSAQAAQPQVEMSVYLLLAASYFAWLQLASWAHLAAELTPLLSFTHLANAEQSASALQMPTSLEHLLSQHGLTVKAPDAPASVELGPESALMSLTVAPVSALVPASGEAVSTPLSAIAPDVLPLSAIAPDVLPLSATAPDVLPLSVRPPDVLPLSVRPPDVLPLSVRPPDVAPLELDVPPPSSTLLMAPASPVSVVAPLLEDPSLLPGGNKQAVCFFPVDGSGAVSVHTEPAGHCCSSFHALVVGSQSSRAVNEARQACSAWLGLQLEPVADTGPLVPVGAKLPDPWLLVMHDGAMAQTSRGMHRRAPIIGLVSVRTFLRYSKRRVVVSDEVHKKVWGLGDSRQSGDGAGCAACQLVGQGDEHRPTCDDQVI